VGRLRVASVADILYMTGNFLELLVPLRRSVESLRTMQEADGSVLDTRHVEAKDVVESIIGSLQAVSSSFPSQADYFDALENDFKKWVQEGFCRPDFFVSLLAFQPQLDRSDSRLWLIIFPIYTPNSSSKVHFEMVLGETPWPQWLAEIESSEFYRNAGFVPMRIKLATSGYDSPCAVLFPEMVSTGSRPPEDIPNNWGTIFCDKEAERFRVFIKEAAEAERISLPQGLLELLDDQEGTESVFLLWDMIHDRTHMQGTMPFDPFMVRQRHPYWMYSIEELRCDVTALTEMASLAAQGLSPVGESGPQVVFLDRMLRFPVTGPRTRNYDGLAGQVLLGAMVQAGVVEEQGEGLSVDWQNFVDAAWVLRREIEYLYRVGSRSNQVIHWLNGWDFVSKYVAPREDSIFAKSSYLFAGSSIPEREDILQRVNPDEFPLGLFYERLKTLTLTS